MVKVAVQCVLQDCTVIVLVKVNARIVKKGTCVVEESRVNVLKVPMLLPRDQRLVLHPSPDIMYPQLVPPIRLYVLMVSIHKQEHQNALIVRQDQHAEMDIDILVSQVVILPVVNLHVSLVPQGLSPYHPHHLHVHHVLLGCMHTVIAHTVSIVKVDTTVKLE